MKRMAKAFWLITTIAWVGLFFYLYAYFQDVVNIKVYLRDSGYVAISTNEFFYLGITIFVFFNALCFILLNAIKGQPVGPKQFLINEKFKQSIKFWTEGLAAVFTFFQISILFYLAFINNEEGLSRMGYEPWVWASAVLLIGWFTASLVLILKRVSPKNYPASEKK